MFVVKYRPKSLKDFVNQKEALAKFINWYNSWRPGEKAALLYGKPGVGKTCLVEAFANDKNLQLIQMNASDTRSRKQIEEIFVNASQSLPIFKKGKIFLVDEVDGIAGREDVGGIQAIVDLIKKTRYPVVLTANDVYDQKLRAIREYCELIELKPLTVWDVEKKLKEICEKEGIEYEKEVLNMIAKRSDGDLRAAINDLETLVSGRKKISLKDLEILGYREREREMFEALKILFKTTSLMGAKMSISNVDLEPDTIFWWIEENIPNEYEKPEEIAEAFERLAKADLFRARIIHRNYWKLLRYFNDLMTAGVSLAKKDVYRKFTKYSFPSKLRYLSTTKDERGEEKEFLLKLSKILNCSTKKIRKEFNPYFQIFQKDSSFLEYIQKLKNQ
ncbi:MAG: replication factor C large subunit [Candidatus Aenigmarchaeota archaeon]|nr:replication factor C large subunit [Candidatus Aenigmarchaeota archaeon]MDW8159999.1 replication factor C large subunit [Candidatus Aenigmarchaeota archaeon]